MVVSRPPVLFRLSLAVAALIATLIGFAVLAGYSARVSASGQLRADAGVITITAPVAGAVDRFEPAEGDALDAGRVVAHIKSLSQRNSGASLAGDLKQAMLDRRTAIERALQSQLQVLDERELSVRTQIRQLAEERGQFEDELDNAKRQLGLAERSLARAREVHGKGFVSDAELQSVELDVLRLQSQALAAERAIQSSGRTLTQLRQELATLPRQRSSQQAEADGRLAALAQELLENEGRGGFAVSSTVDGVVTATFVERGQTVQAGQPLFAVLPAKSRLEAQLLVPSRAVGFIEPGDRVRLRLQAYPYQKFGHQSGRVLRVSRSALGSTEQAALLGSGAASEPMYRVLVALDQQHVLAYGQAEPLLPGMVVEADVMLEDRQLYEWVLEPLYALRGRIAS